MPSKQAKALAALPPKARDHFKFKPASEVRRGDAILRFVIDGVGCCCRVVDAVLDDNRPDHSIRFSLNNGEKCNFSPDDSVAVDDSGDGPPDTPSQAFLAAIGIGTNKGSEEVN